MKRHRWKTGFWAAAILIVLALMTVGCSGDAAGEEGEVAGDPLANLTDEAKACVECHATETAGIVADWDSSVHAQEAVSCVDCHEVAADSPLAIPDIEGHEDVSVPVAALVQPNTCAECHEDQPRVSTVPLTRRRCRCSLVRHRISVDPGSPAALRPLQPGPVSLSSSYVAPHR